MMTFQRILMMTKQSLYKFIAQDIPSDIIDAKGKVTKYKEVNSIAKDEESARVKSKLDSSYTLVKTYKLDAGWNAE